ncbi:MAG TPA: NAD(P)/FAD-dependent oxidoreductase [Kofleriaceae bacterium]|nr:NAD(P)/FAD-dependent oxidoreductase [Kofleriaceae bacterium]
MTEPHLLIIGGGLAGLSTGCYARASGFRTTIVEHNLALGGVCTAWQRGPYTIDGCIHWLTGGPFDRFYEELGILPGVERRVLDEWLTYRDASNATSIRITRDLDALGRDLTALAPTDRDEIARVIAGARELGDLAPPTQPRQLLGVREQLGQLWDQRHHAGTLLHFRKPLATWMRDHLTSPALQRLIGAILPGQVPAMFLCTLLGYLERGYLSRPVGGSARFRDALIARYKAAGGEARTGATVDEVLVQDGRAVGVRLDDGTIVTADLVVSTASLPETALRLLGGRYDAADVRTRSETWRLLGPIVLASFGVAAPLRDLPGLWIIDRIAPFALGGASNEHLYVRVCNDDPALAPAGHAVVQTMLTTSYGWWATRGAHYAADKDAVAEIALDQLAAHIPGLRAAVRLVDVATPLTFWKMARAWRGAFEGWMPEHGSMLTSVPKTFGTLSGLYLAGQWVEPGGGVPTAIASGRQAVQLACADRGLAFRAPEQR